MIKKNIKRLHFIERIETYTWYKGSQGMTDIIFNYYKENHKIKDVRCWHGTQGEWNIEIDYVYGGMGFIEPEETLLMYYNRKNL